ncbi:hypothetical protein KIN20_012593 [Parelaphostrongylus tenuis]|uniref:Uncharacterized protein n=1 Tax=Parelaphostrongylus tenuis TaxID=148309 RepID=A0AAD5MWF5_PARTN|nr:hypothetical protein KIN20_012593 [Parelaphostrongylus tenuis]
MVTTTAITGSGSHLFDSGTPVNHSLAYDGEHHLCPDSMHVVNSEECQRHQPVSIHIKLPHMPRE